MQNLHEPAAAEIQGGSSGDPVREIELRREMMSDTARIWFDGHQFALPRADHSGENLRAFFGVKRGKDLFVESDEGDDILIAPDDTVYFVENRDKFYSVSKKINQG